MAENNKDNDRDDLSRGWKKAKIIITGFATIAAILVPIAAAYIGNAITQSLKEKEMGHKYVELAVGVLKEKETPETKNIRKWAQKIVDYYSPVKMSEQAKEEVLKTPFPGAVSYVPAYRIPTEPRKIKMVIICDTGTPNAKSVINFMRHPETKTSYHYVIDTDGKLDKLADEQNIAFFVGKSRWKGLENLGEYSIGIGLAHVHEGKDNFMKLPQGHPALGPKYPAEQITTLINLLVNISSRHGLKPEDILTKQDVSEWRVTDLHGEELNKIRKIVAAKLKNMKSD